jgi:hypothetical protein
VAVLVTLVDQILFLVLSYQLAVDMGEVMVGQVLLEVLEAEVLVAERF